MNILLAAATPFEIAPTLDWLETHARKSEDAFELGEHVVQICITGVGMPLTAWRMGQWLCARPVDFAIQAGVAGVFHDKWPLTTVVEVTTERFGDLGAEEADGSFTSVHDMGLIDPDAPPFRGGVLHNDRSSGFAFLPKAHGLTVNTVTGTEASIHRVRRLYPDADVENMEGAAFFLACLSANVPFVSIRSLSNRVEPRNRAGWQLHEAIDALNGVLTELVQTFAEARD